MASMVQFISLTQDEYDGLASKQSSSLYFTYDTHRLYKGDSLYGSGDIDEIECSNLYAYGITLNGQPVLASGSGGGIAQMKEDVASGVINLTLNRSLYVAELDQSYDLEISTDDMETEIGSTNDVDLSQYAITFELELNVTVDDLSISYPWTWIDEDLAPDLSVSGCYTIAVRGNYRNNAWVWRANLQDTTAAY